jgi:hypothetical protein
MPQIVGCYPNELKQRVGGVIHSLPRSDRLPHRNLGLGSRPSSSVFHCCFHPTSRSYSPPPFCSFSNSGVITIGALFVVVHTMGRTHVISNLCHKVLTCFFFPLFFLLCFLNVRYARTLLSLHCRSFNSPCLTPACIQAFGNSLNPKW